MPVTIYHNPRCAKSRAALKLLEDRGLKLRVVEHLKTPPSEAQLRHLLKLLNLSPRELLRRKEPEYKQAGLDNPEYSDAQIVRAMIIAAARNYLNRSEQNSRSWPWVRARRAAAIIEKSYEFSLLTRHDPAITNTGWQQRGLPPFKRNRAGSISTRN